MPDSLKFQIMQVVTMSFIVTTQERQRLTFLYQ